jgi:hypothetical protein
MVDQDSVNRLRAIVMTDSRSFSAVKKFRSPSATMEKVGIVHDVFIHIHGISIHTFLDIKTGGMHWVQSSEKLDKYLGVDSYGRPCRSAGISVLSELFSSSKLLKLCLYL